jgi:iron complex outermembrane receptor protein
LIVNRPTASPINFVFDNRGEERTQGAELGFTWVPLSYAKVTGSWTAFHAHTSDRSPNHSWQMHTAFDLTSDVELDLGFYYQGRRVFASSVPEEIGSQTRVDVRLGWIPRPGLRLAIVGQNLLDRQHMENNSGGFAAQKVEIERSAFVEASWAF